MIKVGVFGASGRMGATVCEMVVGDPDLELVAAVDPHLAGLDLRQAIGLDVPGLMIMPDTNGLEDTGVEVMVDFTVLQAAKRNLTWCAEHGVRCTTCSPASPIRTPKQAFQPELSNEVLNAHLFESIAELRAITVA